VLVVSTVKQALRGDSVGVQSGTVKLVGQGLEAGAGRRSLW
jgi:hypothetical protein